MTTTSSHSVCLQDAVASCYSPKVWTISMNSVGFFAHVCNAPPGDLLQQMPEMRGPPPKENTKMVKPGVWLRFLVAIVWEQ
eukprot:2355828-Amphidinium_carterae.1